MPQGRVTMHGDVRCNENMCLHCGGSGKFYFENETGRQWTKPCKDCNETGMKDLMVEVTYLREFINTQDQEICQLNRKVRKLERIVNEWMNE